jgi:integrase
MRIRLNQPLVDKATCPAGRDRVIYWDQTQRRFGLMVTETGHKSFVVQYHARDGSSRRMKIDGVLKLEQARKQAEKLIGEVASGGDPLARIRKERNAGKTTLKAVCDSYFESNAGKSLRTAGQRRADLERLVFPKLGNIQIEVLTWKRILHLLNIIEDERGAAMADATKGHLRRIFNWYAGRTDDFRSPIPRVEKRNTAGPRSRTLTDDELRAVWRAAEKRQDAWGRYIQFLILTGTRRNEAAHAGWDEIAGADWMIPAHRYKTGLDTLIPLSKPAQRIIASIPRIDGCPHIFSNDAKRPLGGFSKLKAGFDKACGVTDWRLHDLRRTARTLLSRAGVSPDTAERCLGHAIGGIRGTYDKHDYAAEKRQGFEALAALIDRIINPQDNVVTLGGIS